MGGIIGMSGQQLLDALSAALDGTLRNQP